MPTQFVCLNRALLTICRQCFLWSKLQFGQLIKTPVVLQLPSLSVMFQVDSLVLIAVPFYPRQGCSYLVKDTYSLVICKKLCLGSCHGDALFSLQAHKCHSKGIILLRQSRLWTGNIRQIPRDYIICKFARPTFFNCPSFPLFELLIFCWLSYILAHLKIICRIYVSGGWIFTAR